MIFDPYWRSDDLPWPAKNALPDETIRANIVANLARDVPRFKPMPAHDGTFVFVGGAPSVNDYLDEIRERQKDATVFTSGKTIEHLCQNDIVPWGYINVDPKKHVAYYINPIPDETRFFISSVSDPVMFSRLAGKMVWVIHTPTNANELDLYETEKDPFLIQGGVTTALRAMTLAYAMGYRQIEFYGVDSSFTDSAYAYEKVVPNQITCEVETVDGQQFLTTPVWAMQAEAFDKQVAEWLEADESLRFLFHGNGLLPHLMRLHNEPPAKMPEWAQPEE